MAKKFWTIYPRTKEAQVQGLQTDKGVVDFGGKTSLNTSDEGLVKAVNEQHKSNAYAVHDEQLSKAYDSGSWDVIQDNKGVRVKNLHNYTFTVTKPKKSTRLEEFKKWLSRKGLSNYFWFWDIEHNGKHETGVRILGKEFLWQR